MTEINVLGGDEVDRVALVTAGLSAGDRVVTLGVHKLTAGTRVRTVEASSDSR